MRQTSGGIGKYEVVEFGDSRDFLEDNRAISEHGVSGEWAKMGIGEGEREKVRILCHKCTDGVNDVGIEGRRFVRVMLKEVVLLHDNDLGSLVNANSTNNDKALSRTTYIPRLVFTALVI